MSSLGLGVVETDCLQPRGCALQTAPVWSALTGRPHPVTEQDGGLKVPPCQPEGTALVSNVTSRAQGLAGRRRAGMQSHGPVYPTLLSPTLVHRCRSYQHLVPTPNSNSASAPGFAASSTGLSPGPLHSFLHSENLKSQSSPDHVRTITICQQTAWDGTDEGWTRWKQARQRARGRECCENGQVRGQRVPWG